MLIVSAAALHTATIKTSTEQLCVCAFAVQWTEVNNVGVPEEVRDVFKC